MKALNKLCNVCQEKKDIIKIERDEQSEVVTLSCDHRIISIEMTEKIGLSDRISWKHKRPGHKKHIGEGKQKTKISGETEKLAKEEIVIDRIAQKYIHKVWEQNENGKWELEHEEEMPLSHKGKEYLISIEKKCPKCESVNIKKTGGAHKLQAQVWHHGFKCLDCNIYFWITESNLKP